MLTICKDNREEIENEYIALLINKPELIDINQIRPKYLYNKDNQKLFETILNCYNQNKVINPALLVQTNREVDLDRFVKLAINTFYYETTYKQQMSLSEESIIKFYKEDIINNLNQKLKDKEISYDDFMNKTKKLDEITISKDDSLVTFEKLMDSRTTKDMIQIKKYKTINNKLNLVQGDFLVIGATTGGGKSAFLINLMNDLKDRYQCIYFNMEMSEHTMFTRMLSVHTGITMEQIANPLTEYQESRIRDAAKEFENFNIYVEQKASDIKQIRQVVAKRKKQNQHTILFIDHLGLVRSDKNKSLYEQATDVSKELRQICLDYDCTVIAASQLNRTAYSSDRLILSQLKDSGELENSASKVMIIQKQMNPSAAVTDIEIDIAKNRDGQEGTIRMSYDKERQIFTEREN